MGRTGKVSDRQAAQILAILIEEGKLRESEIRTALARHQKKIEELRARIRRLEGGDGPFPMERVGVRRPRPRFTKASRPRRTARRVSAKRRRAMRQQGLYLAAVRRLKPADRASVKAVRTQKGFQAAISEARKLAKRG